MASFELMKPISSEAAFVAVEEVCDRIRKRLGTRTLLAVHSGHSYTPTYHTGITIRKRSVVPFQWDILRTILFVVVSAEADGIQGPRKPIVVRSLAAEQFQSGAKCSSLGVVVGTVAKHVTDVVNHWTRLTNWRVFPAMRLRNWFVRYSCLFAFYFSSSPCSVPFVSSFPHLLQSSRSVVLSRLTSLFLLNLIKKEEERSDGAALLCRFFFFLLLLGTLTAQRGVQNRENIKGSQARSIFSSFRTGP